MSEPVSSELPMPELPTGMVLRPPRPTTVRRPGTASLPDLPPKAPGERFGAYELTRKLAESGIGEVYQAIRVADGQSGILKRIKRERAASAIARRRFEFEMELGRVLRHPHLVVVLDSGVIDDRPYLFMQEIRGPSMRQLLQGVAPWTATRELLLGALEQVGQGLAYCHRAGVCHGDVKPENILLESPQKAVVIDFGLAYRFVGGVAGVPADPVPGGYIVGTPVYLPPERLRGETGALSAATDVYAYGVLLYEALVGRPPFVLEGSGDSAAQLASLVARVGSEPVPPMQSAGGPVAPAWEALCRRCLEKKPQNRPVSLEPVVADVGAILRTGQPVSVPPGGVVQRITRWLIKGGR